ncbi:Gti1/Pac2 family-domain-containing protein [Radiomyces spectabilis]|uniref:Gti1/Pac2 family-domain-containing protein n=1 Tax=Radiomyces spectabilis TaxID=64574 RepID=UPI00221F5E50|nr:Gti1/Pac2 family-domain-containing protein [Radiomyces spectabilis]KAI8365199.1 Gti1/Pac2 family-domain-containing protein [Radiomyces spectabilis]
MTETFHGYIETTQDVLLVFEGCRRGLLPTVSRRLQDKERKMIQSGSVFVFDERESGIKRWTDGLVWSPSRILGNFLIYRELDKRSIGDKKHSMSSLSNDSRQRSYSADQSSASSQISAVGLSIDRTKERRLVGSLSDSYKFRKDGLIKKTMSIVVNGVPQHLISYYHPQDILQNRLRTPSSVPELASLEISPELLVKQNFRIPPMVEPTFEQSKPTLSGQMSPVDVLTTVYGERRAHPLRSMSVGSLRGEPIQPTGFIGRDMGSSQMMYNSPYQRMDLEQKHSPTLGPYGNPSIPMSMYGGGYPPIPSPNSMSSSPGTPILSPVRPSFQHQRNYSTSSASSTSLSSSMSRLDTGTRHGSYDMLPSYQPSASERSHPAPYSSSSMGQVHPHMISETDYYSHNERQDAHHHSPLSLPNPQQPSPQRYASNPNIGQLLNPVHPLHSNNASAELPSPHPNQALLQSMAMTNTATSPYHHSYSSANRDYNPKMMGPNECAVADPAAHRPEESHRGSMEGSGHDNGGGGGIGYDTYAHYHQRQQQLTNTHTGMINQVPMYRNGIMDPMAQYDDAQELLDADFGKGPLMLK